MINKLKSSLFIIILLAVAGCATANRKSSKKVKQLVAVKKYDKALQLVKSDDFYPEKRSLLLKLLEEGMIHHLNGSYYQSTKALDKARELSNKLFTVSVSKKLTAAVSNSNSDNYYGEKYERSLIRFYLALNHYLMYQKGTYEPRVVKVKNVSTGKIIDKTIPEKKLTQSQRLNHLSASRATILEWDSLLDNYKGQLAGDDAYKDDLSAKVFGAFIHEQIGSGSDRQIALQLYRDAKKILFRNYNTYSAFNKKSEKFRKNFSKFPTMNIEKVKKNYISKTDFYKNLVKYIDRKILALKKRKSDNFQVMIQQGFITPKTVKKIDFPLPVSALAAGSAVASGAKNPVTFVIKVLGLSSVTKPTITFELPEVKKIDFNESYEVIVKSGKKVIKKVDTVMVNPLSQIAYEALDNKVISTYAKIGARVAGKHVAALVTSYVAYNLAIKQGIPEFVALLTATGSYSLANKGIAASEQADLRYWASLPSSLRVASARLPKGKYKVFLKSSNSGKSPIETFVGDIDIDSEKKVSLMNLKL